MTRATYHSLTVREVVEETADACSILFDLPEDLRTQFTYRPGQFLTLHVPCGDSPLPRCYSLSSTPIADEPLRVTVKRVADGRASNWLCTHLRAGDRLDVAAPAGIFTPKTFDGDFLLFAGGSGITPVYSIIRSVLASGTGRLRLIFANRDERSVIFGKELAELSRRHPQRLQVVHWLDVVQGVPSKAQIGALAEGWTQAQCFICGPGLFMDAAAAALHDLGVPHSQVHIERFVSLPEDSEDDTPTAPVSGGSTCEIIVELDGVTTQLQGNSNQLLIETMEAAGLQPPYSCRAGACAACMCTLIEGNVDMRHNHVLDANDLKQGWILACQSVPQSSRLHLRYPT